MNNRKILIRISCVEKRNFLIIPNLRRVFAFVTIDYADLRKFGPVQNIEASVQIIFSAFDVHSSFIFYFF